MQTAMDKSPPSGRVGASSRPNLLTAEQMEQIDLEIYSAQSWKLRRAETLARKARWAADTSRIFEK